MGGVGDNGGGGFHQAPVELTGSPTSESNGDVGTGDRDTETPDSTAAWSPVCRCGTATQGGDQVVCLVLGRLWKTV